MIADEMALERFSGDLKIQCNYVYIWEKVRSEEVISVFLQAKNIIFYQLMGEPYQRIVKD